MRRWLDFSTSNCTNRLMANKYSWGLTYIVGYLHV